MRILIVKLSSLGDVVHAMPVVHDIQAAFPGAVIDWVVEPGFAPLVRRVRGIGEVIDCPLRRWSRGWWTASVRAEWRGFRTHLQRHRYDAVLDLQGLTKSAIIARLAHGVSYGLANRTEGASHEPPARWLVDHAIRIEPHTHAVARSRALAAKALGYAVDRPPRFGLQAGVGAGAGAGACAGWGSGSGSDAVAVPDADADAVAVAVAVADAASAKRAAPPMVVFVHGTSRADKLWPEANWIALGQRAVAEGWLIALPHAGADEFERAVRLRDALGTAAEVWPAMPLDEVVDRLGATQGVIGVDSGLSHIATALDLPHVQLYNFPTAWRTGPQASHGHRHQVSVQGEPTPSVDAVWRAWVDVRDAA